MGARKLRRGVGYLSLVATLVAATILMAVPLPAAAGDVSGVVDFGLRQAALENPSVRVRAIVQGRDPQLLATAVAKHDGRVIRGLPLVGGLAIDVAASAVADLARESGVVRVAQDAPMVTQAKPDKQGINPAKLATVYPWALMAPPLWEGRSPVVGRGVGVAIVDTGIAPVSDFGPGGGRVVANLAFGALTNDPADKFGHGTAVAAVVGGDGAQSGGKYVGIAPQVNLINLKVGDDKGVAFASDVIAAISWAAEHRADYNIRVLNVSLISIVPESYTTSLLDLAVEYAWLRGIVVVVAAGNAADGVLHPPANDPYVITVGATDDRGTQGTGDDALAAFSSHGATQDGFAKPELVAPGRRIVTALASPDCRLAAIAPDLLVGDKYIRLNGTSLSAGEVSGVVAQVLQGHSSYRPDEVKWLLEKTANRLGRLAGTGFGYPNAQRAALYDKAAGLANRGLIPNRYLAQAVANAYFNGVSWDSIDWDNVDWASIDWGGVSWDGVSWDGVSWDGVSWDGVSWDGVSWDGVSWDGVSWDGVSWDGVSWDVITVD